MNTAYQIISRGFNLTTRLSSSGVSSPFDQIDPNKILKSYQNLELNYKNMAITRAGSLELNYHETSIEKVYDLLSSMISIDCWKFSNPEQIYQTCQDALSSNFEDEAELLVAEIFPNDDIFVFTSLCISITRSPYQPTWYESIFKQNLNTYQLNIIIAHKSGSYY
jgi:hypothetical protein